ncbi:hypothetical protein TB2_029584 [Malus domestica]
MGKNKEVDGNTIKRGAELPWQEETRGKKIIRGTAALRQQKPGEREKQKFKGRSCLCSREKIYEEGGRRDRRKPGETGNRRQRAGNKKGNGRGEQSQRESEGAALGQREEAGVHMGDGRMGRMDRVRRGD